MTRPNIPIGIPTATKQSPILMCMEYLVFHPDHAFVVASKHKLIPSIYTLRDIKPSGLTYSGPNHAAFRSFKHDNTNVIAGFDNLKNHLGMMISNHFPNKKMTV